MRIGLMTVKCKKNAVKPDNQSKTVSLVYRPAQQMG